MSGKAEASKEEEAKKKLLEESKEKVIAFFRKSPDKALSLFEKFLNIARGKVDIKHRLRLLLQPDNILTTTRLTRSQVDYMSLSFFVAREFPEEGFEPLERLATLFGHSAISYDGLGRTEAIQYEGAISESKLLKGLNIFGTQEAKGKKAGEKT